MRTTKVLLINLDDVCGDCAVFDPEEDGDTLEEYVCREGKKPMKVMKMARYILKDIVNVSFNHKPVIEVVSTKKSSGKKKDRYTKLFKVDKTGA